MNGFRFAKADFGINVAALSALGVKERCEQFVGVRVNEAAKILLRVCCDVGRNTRKMSAGSIAHRDIFDSIASKTPDIRGGIFSHFVLFPVFIDIYAYCIPTFWKIKKKLRNIISFEHKIALRGPYAY
jgi:hypothetical protein